MRKPEISMLLNEWHVSSSLSRAKKAELTQKKEQRQAAVQKQEMLNKQMANIMGKFFKPIDKSSSVTIVCTLIVAHSEDLLTSLERWIERSSEQWQYPSTMHR